MTTSGAVAGTLGGLPAAANATHIYEALSSLRAAANATHITAAADAVSDFVADGITRLPDTALINATRWAAKVDRLDERDPSGGFIFVSVAGIAGLEIVQGLVCLALFMLCCTLGVLSTVGSLPVLGGLMVYQQLQEERATQDRARVAEPLAVVELQNTGAH